MVLIISNVAKWIKNARRYQTSLVFFSRTLFPRQPETEYNKQKLNVKIYIQFFAAPTEIASYICYTYMIVFRDLFD